MPKITSDITRKATLDLLTGVTSGAGKALDLYSEAQAKKMYGTYTSLMGDREGITGEPKMIIVSPEQEELFTQQGSNVQAGTRLTPGAFNYLMRKPLDEKKYLLSKGNADIIASRYKLTKKKVYFNILSDIYDEIGIPKERQILGKRIPLTPSLQEQYQNEVIPILESYGFTQDDFPFIWTSAGQIQEETKPPQKPQETDLPEGVTEEDIQFTMQQHGLTREEVLEALQPR